MCSEAWYPLGLFSAAATLARDDGFEPVATAAATPALPRPAASRKLRRLVGLIVFMSDLLFAKTSVSIQLQRLRLDFGEGRAERGHVPVVVRLGRAREGFEETRGAGGHVILEEFLLFGEPRRGA